MTDQSEVCCRKPAPKAASEDQVCLITGCASGIGRGTALAFAALNYNLVLVDKQKERLSETAELCMQKSPKKYKVSQLRILISARNKLAT